MRNTIIATAILGSIVASSAAYASSDVVGVVKSFDTKAHTLTLADGKVFTFKKHFKLDGNFAVGAKVDISYDMQGKHRVIEKLKPAA